MRQWRRGRARPTHRQCRRRTDRRPSRTALGDGGKTGTSKGERGLWTSRFCRAFGRRVSASAWSAAASARSSAIPTSSSFRADGFCDLVAGALSSTPDVAHRVRPRRSCSIPTDPMPTGGRWRRAKAARRGRIDAVVIATPPQLHFPVAKALPRARHRRDLREADDARPRRGRGDAGRPGAQATTGCSA